MAWSTAEARSGWSCVSVYLSFVLFNSVRFFPAEIKSTNMWKKCSTEKREQRKTYLTVNSQMQQRSYSWEPSKELESLSVLAVLLVPQRQMSWPPGVLIRLTVTSAIRKAFLVNLCWSLMSAVCMEDSSTTSLFSISIINRNGPRLCLRLSFLEALSTDLALAKRFTKNSSLYHYTGSSVNTGLH